MEKWIGITLALILGICIGGLGIIYATHQSTTRNLEMPSSPDVTLTATINVSSPVPLLTPLKGYVYSTKDGYQYYPSDYVCTEPLTKYVNNSEGQIVGQWCKSGYIHRVETPKPTLRPEETPHSMYMYSTARGLMYRQTGYICTEKSPSYIYNTDGTLKGIWCVSGYQPINSE